MAITAAARTNIIELNVLAGNGAPGTTGLGALVATYNISGIAGVAASITTSASWTAKFPTFQTPEEFGKEFLEMIVPGLSAAGMAEGITIIAGLINSGSSQADVLLASSNFLSATSATDAAFGDYAAKFQNQTAVAIFHTVTQEKASPRALDDVTSDAATIVTAKADIDGSTAAAAAATAAADAAAALTAAQPALDAASAAALTAYNTAAATSVTDATAASDAATAATTAAAAVTSLALANSSVTAAALAASTAATSVTSAAAATAAAATLATAAAATVSTTDDAGATAATAATVAAAAAAAAAVTAAATQVSTAAPIPATYAGSTFTLTTGLDTGASFTGGAGADSFVGVDNNVATTGTLTAGDSLVGGDGVDSLTIAASGTASTPVISTDGIEVLNVINNAGTGVTYDATLMSGLESLKVTAGLNATTISNSEVLLDVTALNTNKNITVTSATPALGAADSSTITLTGVGTGAAGTTITSDGVETFNVVLAGAASGSAVYGNVTLASNELETVNVSGNVAALLTVDLTGADLVSQTATFDASEATAGVTANITAGGSTKLAVTGGAGNDSFTVGALDKDYTITGGDGVDTLVATAGAPTGLAAADYVGVGVSGFERISAASAGSVNLSSLSNNDFIATYGAGTYSKAAALIANSYLTATTGTLTVTRATDTTADALNVHIEAATAATVAVSIANEETVTVNSAGLATNVDHTISSLAAADMTSLTVIGHNGLIVSSLTGEEALATVNAGAHTGKTLTLNAADSNADMTVTGSAGAPITDGATVNSITTGSGDDAVTGGDYADTITTGLGADTVTGGAGNDTITTNNGNDVIDAGEGNDTITAGSGDDSITGGAGNDIIDAGTGSDTIDAGAGTDRIVATISDSTVIDGGAGTDTLQATTSAITSTSAASVAGAMISVAESVTPSITGVETAYLLVDGDASAAAASTTVIVDLAAATDLATLHLGTDETTSDGSYIKIKDFAGSTVTLYGGISGTTSEIENLTIDGVGQSAINLTLENWNGVGAADLLTVTGTSALNITSKSTSQFTGNAAQDNLLDDVTAASVGTFSVTTSGSTSTANGASALTIDVVTATQASTVNLTVGTNDDLALDEINATGDAVENSTLTVGTDAILDVDTLNYDASTLDAMTLTVSDGGFVANSGANTTVATTEYVDLTAASIADLNIDLGSGAKATLDLSGIELTDMDATLDSSSALFLKSSLGKAATDSSFVFTGRGDLDFDDATRIGDSSVNLLGGTVTFSTAGLTLDADPVAVHSSATTGATITTSLGADAVSGGAGNDVISTGDGNDRVGLTGRVETYTMTYDAGDTTQIVINGVTAGPITHVTDLGTTVGLLIAAVNADSETSFATAATGGTGEVVVTYQQYFGTSGAATDVETNGANANTTDTALAVTTAGDNAGADSITLGEGTDTVVAGSAADTVTLTETTSAADIVLWTGTTAALIATETGAATGDTDFTAGTAGDKVVGFISGTDTLHFDATLTTSAAGIEVDTLVTIAAAGTVPATAMYVEITTAFDGTTGDAITDLNALTTSAVAIGDSFIAFMNDGTNGYLFLVEQVSTADTIAAQDVTLIGQVAGVTDIANGDLVDF